MALAARPGDKLVGPDENVTRLVALATIRARVAQDLERHAQVFRGAAKSAITASEPSSASSVKPAQLLEHVATRRTAAAGAR